MRIATLFLLSTLFAASAEMPLIQPPDMVARLSAKPAIFYVGPNVFYRSKHIPGAVFAGPGSQADGLDLLKAAVAKIPHDREIVLYCGCCPWDRCPNVQPTLDLMKQMGFTRVKVLHLPDNFKTDWIDKGYPVE